MIWFVVQRVQMITFGEPAWEYWPPSGDPEDDSWNEGPMWTLDLGSALQFSDEVEAVARVMVMEELDAPYSTFLVLEVDR